MFALIRMLLRRHLPRPHVPPGGGALFVPQAVPLQCGNQQSETDADGISVNPLAFHHGTMVFIRRPRCPDGLGMKCQHGQRGQGRIAVRHRIALELAGLWSASTSGDELGPSEVSVAESFTVLAPGVLLEVSSPYVSSIRLQMKRASASQLESTIGMRGIDEDHLLPRLLDRHQRS